MPARIRVLLSEVARHLVRQLRQRGLGPDDQARAERLTVLTGDSRFEEYDVAMIDATL